MKKTIPTPLFPICGDPISPICQKIIAKCVAQTHVQHTCRGFADDDSCRDGEIHEAHTHLGRAIGVAAARACQKNGSADIWGKHRVTAGATDGRNGSFLLRAPQPVLVHLCDGAKKVRDREDELHEQQVPVGDRRVRSDFAAAAAESSLARVLDDGVDGRPRAPICEHRHRGHLEAQREHK